MTMDTRRLRVGPAERLGSMPSDRAELLYVRSVAELRTVEGLTPDEIARAVEHRERVAAEWLGWEENDRAAAMGR